MRPPLPPGPPNASVTKALLADTLSHPPARTGAVLPTPLRPSTRSRACAPADASSEEQVEILVDDDDDDRAEVGSAAACLASTCAPSR